MRGRKISLTFFLMALIVIGSLPITSPVSAADVEGGVNVEPVVEETIFNAISHTEVTTDLGNWDITMTLNNAALNNNTTFDLITQICNNDGICLAPESAVISSEDNRTFTSSVTTIEDHTYVNWRVKATYSNDNDTTEMFPSSGFYKTWSDCWLNDEQWGGDGCTDSDNDGVHDGIDKCPSSNNPAPSDMDKSIEVDSTGCFVEAVGSESDSELAAGLLGVMFILVVVIFGVRKIRSPKQEQVFYAQTQVVSSPVQQHSVSKPQTSLREKELEHQSRQAQIEAQRLRQLLANQAQLTQQLKSEAAQKQMSDAALAQKQHELAVAQQEKEELEAKLAEAEKNTSIVQNITYNIQDSAISGDITNKIN